MRMSIEGAEQGNRDLSCAIEGFEGAERFREFSRSNAYSLLLAEGFKGRVEGDEEFLDFDGGAFLLSLSPYQAFRLAAGASDGPSGFLIRFHPDFLCVYKNHRELACDGVLFDDAYGFPLLRLGEAETAEFRALALRMVEELGGDLAAADEVILSCLKILLVGAVRLRRLSREYGGREGPAVPGDPILRDFRQAVERDFRSLHAVEDYARLLGIGPKSLGRICREGAGKGPRAIIIDRVVIEAKRELYLGDRSIKEIAYLLGYRDEFHFSRLFKSATGVSPVRYREKIGSGRAKAGASRSCADEGPR